MSAKVKLKVLSPADEAYIRAAAYAEWDRTVPRWNMSREAFADWAVLDAKRSKPS